MMFLSGLYFGFGFVSLLWLFGFSKPGRITVILFFALAFAFLYFGLR